MGTTIEQTGRELRENLDKSVKELETLASEIRVKIHLAGMDAKSAWKKLEPQINEARDLAREAKESSTKAVRDMVKAARDLAQKL